MHHPINVADYYEDQKDEAAARAKAYREGRLPKFLKHFEAVLQANPEVKNNGGTYLVGSTTTMADLVVFQVRKIIAFPPRTGTQRPSAAVGARWSDPCFPETCCRLEGNWGVRQRLCVEGTRRR